MSSMSRDHWNHKAYNSAASFVPKLATRVLQWLDPQPQDRILDVGCGDGILTAEIASRVTSVVGLDASEAMIRSARSQITARHSNASFYILDCRHLDADSSAKIIAPGQTFDKVFSSAAMHWILSDASVRQSFFDQIYALVTPGGSFVFEMGGFGNVADARAATLAILRFKYGVNWDLLERADPWYFCSVEWMEQTLVTAGFVVEKIESEYRPTRQTEKKTDKSGGLHGWVRLMCAQLLELLPENKRDQAADDVVQVLEHINIKEDGSEWLGYVRLRAVARKKA